ncbi:hypothetical protein Fmac_024010 [Flemingia macrophylla]|uniref:Uncharacterized protein n=1 Tax=Flemingia macrophylla TaxID=520843 RepID=A0ABD1LN63_9FABA
MVNGFVSISELCHILTNIGKKLEPFKFDKWIRELLLAMLSNEGLGKLRFNDKVMSCQCSTLITNVQSQPFEELET